MPIAPDQLAAGIDRRGLARAYLVFGDEPLQVQESVDRIRAAARADGADERIVFDVDAGFDWHELSSQAAEMSLFATRRLLEVRLRGRKPDKAGAGIIAQELEREDAADVWLFTADNLDRKAQQAKWFKAVDKAGVTVQCRQVPPAQLEQWILRRARGKGLELTAGAAELLAIRGEGNCLAIAQEIDKLRLLVEGAACDADTVMSAIADSARYSVFGLVDVTLAGDAVKAVRMLRGLREEGTEAVVIGWAVNRELRTLATISAALGGGKPVQSVLNEHKVWDSRARIVTQALKRHTTASLTHLLRDSIRLDRIIKGALPGNPWDELELLCLELAGGRRAAHRNVA